MARKELSDFDENYQAFADYLESAECANDEGYDVVADENGNIYTPTNGDWTQGHGHINTKNGYNRPADSPNSIGRPWKNNWAVIATLSNLSFEELQIVEALHKNEYIRNSARRLMQYANNDLLNFNDELSKKR